MKRMEEPSKAAVLGSMKAMEELDCGEGKMFSFRQGTVCSDSQIIVQMYTLEGER